MARDSARRIRQKHIVPFEKGYYRRDTREVARDLLGQYIVRSEAGRRLVVVRIVETEAYLGAPDPASHAFGGRHTPRNSSLYLAGGHAYVYFVYGMHHCLNAVTGSSENGDAVLIRAAEAVHGESIMVRRRGLSEKPDRRPVDLAGGPARLCQALGVDRALDGHVLASPPLQFASGPAVADRDVLVGPRVGIGYAGPAVHWPLRFAIKDCASVSRPRTTLQRLTPKRWGRIMAVAATVSE
ncbi:MAG: DNA-3-methyladenine glycosylase [Planctomycetes bacterium]|nr:DNA-3-methyladenine glycosylase [Planctomycetota bacterium]NOG53422.1 DNA-3-methyladenine glycosylase [Planctomycetota bacterium]